MATLFVRHQVADFVAWKAGYDKYESLRKDLGVKSDGVYQSVDNANDVTVYHEFETIEAAKTFAGHQDLKAAMDELGVQGAPQVWIANRI